MKSRSTDEAPQIAGVSLAVPPHRLDQQQALQAVRGLWEARGIDYDDEWLEYFFERIGVNGRHVALAPEAYAEITDFGAANDHYIEAATTLGAEAVESALATADLGPGDVDAIFFTTVTGVASPSIDARIINALELPRSIQRTPMFGLGCVGGAAGVARMAEYLRARPDHTAVLVAVELCSLTVERNEVSMADYIAAALFADGASAVVAVGAERAARTERAGPRIVDNRSAFFHDTEWVMGWEIDQNGFGLVLSGDLPEVIETELAGEVDAFLGAHELGRDDIGAWISHPGGPKVLEAIGSALALEDGQLDLAWESMAELGNLSSASVLDVLRRSIEGGRLGAAPAVLLAMGPGFAAEFVLIE